MATQRTYVTDKTGTLAQRLRTTDSPSTLVINVTEQWTSVTTGKIQIDEGSNSSWAYFTGVTLTSATEHTLTGVTWGLDKDATSDTDANSTNKRDHKVGVAVKLVLHSYDINKFAQQDRDNTMTGLTTFSGTSSVTLIHQKVTTAQRDALTGVVEGALVMNTTTGTIDYYTGGAWVQQGGTTATVKATELVEGKVRLDIAATDPADPVVPGLNSTRILDATSASSTGKIALGSLGSGNRATELAFVGDATYTAGGLIINRLNTGANANASITHRGSGNFTISAPEGGNIVLDSTTVKTTSPAIQAFTCGEAITTNMLVYYNVADSLVYKATYVALASANILGVAKTTTSGTGQTVYVQTMPGLIEGYSSLTDGASYYLHINGGIISAASIVYNSASVVPVYVGKAVGTTRLQFAPRREVRVIEGDFTINNGTTTTTTLTVGFPVARVDVAYTQGYNSASTLDFNYGQSGVGFYDVRTGTQRCISTFASASSTTKAIGIADLGDIPPNAGKTGTLSINGSNNVEIAWAESTLSTTNIGGLMVYWKATEML